jgi:hypothetical protein
MAAAQAGRGWFPGHMRKATLELQRVLKHVDCVFEVRDARVGVARVVTLHAASLVLLPLSCAAAAALSCQPVPTIRPSPNPAPKPHLAPKQLPFSSANPDLAKLLVGKPRIIVLNKSDLADPAASSAAARKLQGGGSSSSAGSSATEGSVAATAPSSSRPPAMLTCVHQTRSINQVSEAVGVDTANSAARPSSLLVCSQTPGSPPVHLPSSRRQSAYLTPQTPNHAPLTSPTHTS